MKGILLLLIAFVFSTCSLVDENEPEDIVINLKYPVDTVLNTNKIEFDWTIDNKINDSIQFQLSLDTNFNSLLIDTLIFFEELSLEIAFEESYYWKIINGGQSEIGQFKIAGPIPYFTKDYQSQVRQTFQNLASQEYIIDSTYNLSIKLDYSSNGISITDNRNVFTKLYDIKQSLTSDKISFGAGGFANDGNAIVEIDLKVDSLYLTRTANIANRAEELYLAKAKL